MKINQNMRDLRQISGMTQAEVADRVGLTRQAISSYESGRTQPDLDMLVKLADLYQVEATDILYGRGGEQKKLRTVRKMAAIVFGAVSILVFVAAGMLLLMNSFFAVPRGADMANTRQLVEARFAILSVFDALKGIIQGLSWVGCLVLAVEIRRLKRLPSIQKCLVRWRLPRQTSAASRCLLYSILFIAMRTICLLQPALCPPQPFCCYIGQCLVWAGNGL